MNKFWLVVMGLALLVFGCAGFGQNVKDCGTDQQCFKDAMKACTPAKAKITEQGSTIEGLVKGFEGDNCVINMKFVEAPLPIFKDKELTCKVPKADLETFSSGSGSSMGTEKMYQMCSGSFIDLMKSFTAGAGTK